MLGILAAFHEDLVQATMAGRSPQPTLHNFSPAMISLPELLLLARFVLVHIDCAQLTVTPLYDYYYPFWSDQHTFFS
jgi:hypothetical protein